MKLKIKEGTTSKLLKIFVQDSSATDGSGLTGLAYNSSGLSWAWIAEGDASTNSVVPVTATLGTYTSAGFVEVSSSIMPGVYEIGIPNAAIDATSEGSVAMILHGATDMAPVLIEIELDKIDYRDGVRGGMTALPNAAADAAGGLIVSDAGGLDADAFVTKITNIEADTNELQTDWTDGGRLDLLLDATSTHDPAAVYTHFTTGVNEDAFKADITGLQTTCSAIRLKTDDLTFTTENQLDVQAMSIADDAITADATATDFLSTERAHIVTLESRIPDTISLAAIGGEVDSSITAAALATATSIAALNNLSEEDVTSGCASALVDIHLNRFFAATYDADSKPGASGAWCNVMVGSDSGVPQWSPNSLENAPTGGAGTSAITLQSTTIGTVTSQTVFTLAAGCADDDAYNNLTAVITDQTTGTQKAWCGISDYTGSTRTLTLDNAPTFTVASGDIVDILAVPYVTLPKINDEVDTALSDYDAPTRAQMDAAFTTYSPTTALTSFFGSSAQLVDDFWDEPKAGHSTVDTYGAYLDTTVSGVTSGTGGTNVTITIEDAADSSALQNAEITLTEGVDKFVKSTDSDGEAEFSLVVSTSYNYVITKTGYGGASGSLTVPGDFPATIQLTSTGTITTPSDPLLSTGVIVTYNESNVIEGDVPVSVQCVKGDGTAGRALDKKVRTVISDSSTGVAQFVGLGRGYTYRVWRGNAPAAGALTSSLTTEFVVPDAASFDIAEIIGEDAE